MNHVKKTKETIVIYLHQIAAICVLEIPIRLLGVPDFLGIRSTCLRLSCSSRRYQGLLPLLLLHHLIRVNELDRL